MVRLCANCNLPLGEGVCPGCGVEHLTVHLNEFAHAADNSFEVAERTEDGGLLGESVSHSIGHTKSSSRTNLGKPSQFKSEWIGEKPSKHEQEGEPVTRFVVAYNARQGTQYVVEPKSQDAGEAEDRTLVSAHVGEKPIPIQVTHFDTKAIASLHKEGSLDQSLNSDEIVEAIETAIDRKARMYPGAIKSSMVLLLICPYAMGKLDQQNIQERKFDSRGFKEVWVCPASPAVFPVSC